MLMTAAPFLVIMVVLVLMVIVTTAAPFLMLMTILMLMAVAFV